MVVLSVPVLLLLYGYNKLQVKKKNHLYRFECSYRLIRVVVCYAHNMHTDFKSVQLRVQCILLSFKSVSLVSVNGRHEH